MIERQIRQTIENKMFRGKAIVLTGPRQVGKTTLLRQISQNQDVKSLFLSCDDVEVRELLSGINSKELPSLVGNNRIVMIDEAQRVRNIGLTLKQLVDNMPDIQLVVTGSSLLDLANEINEPLTGRKYTYNLFPFSIKELVENSNSLIEKQLLENRLIFGTYPDVVNHAGEERELLLNITESYLYKDVFALADIRKPAQLEKLLTALALQIGSEVSYNELAQTIGANVETVERYIDLLEQCFVVFRRMAFSRNLRNEIKKSKKIYFYDNGIRNALINNFAPLALRQDTGQLWENYFVMERMKYNHYSLNFVKSYFWRTFQGQEIDLIEEIDGKLTAFEMKWNEKRNAKIPVTFSNNYTTENQYVISRKNYMDFLV